MVATDNSTHLLTVVLSAGQSRNPDKRGLEDEVVSRAAEMSGVQVLRIPHLYDLPNNSQSYQRLREIEGDLLVLCWLFDRATMWTLDRNGVRGQVGEVQLREELDDESDEDEGLESSSDSSEETVTALQPRPKRLIYCIDLKVSNKADDFVHEISRIARIANQRLLAPTQGQMKELEQRFDQPTNDTYVGSEQSSSAVDLGALFGAGGLLTIDEAPSRRWYPVIDFSRCTNCMECIDFCLFGVYGVDAQETIVVEQADNCRKGCPACSRVCPQNAIMFPQHKTPAIAGAPVDLGGLKIDLSKLFGAPESDEDAATVAARERDEQLILAGRSAVSSKIYRRDGGAGPIVENPASDDLDQLLNQLDSLDL